MNESSLKTQTHASVQAPLSSAQPGTGCTHAQPSNPRLNPSAVQLKATPAPCTKECSLGDTDLSAPTAAGTAEFCHHATSAAHARVCITMSTASSAALNIVMPHVSCTARTGKLVYNITAVSVP